RLRQRAVADAGSPPGACQIPPAARGPDTRAGSTRAPGAYRSRIGCGRLRRPHRAVRPTVSRSSVGEVQRGADDRVGVEAVVAVDLAESAGLAERRHPQVCGPYLV